MLNNTYNEFLFRLQRTRCSDDNVAFILGQGHTSENPCVGTGDTLLYRMRRSTSRPRECLGIIPDTGNPSLGHAMRICVFCVSTEV